MYTYSKKAKIICIVMIYCVNLPIPTVPLKDCLWVHGHEPTVWVSTHVSFSNLTSVKSQNHIWFSS